MTLNKLQQKAFDAIVKKRVPVLVLTGAAGCGKSATTAAIIQAMGMDIAITATTNKAKEVLAQMSQRPANTVQSQMGFVLSQANFKQNLIKVREAKTKSLVIVEEISMLPFNVYEELMKHLEEGSIKQLLFLGDPIQLKAIGKSIHPNDIEGMHIELTEQMRQDASDIELSTYLQALRTAIETEGTPPAFPNTPALQVLTDHTKFAETYLKTTGIKKVIAYRNRVVDKYNGYIHDGANTFNVGDTVVIDKPLGDARNGDTVNIIAISEDDNFDRQIITVVTGNGGVFAIYQWDTISAYDKVLEDLVNRGDEAAYWSIVNSTVNLKHLYACTVYKAQGSSYDTVFVDGSDLWDAYTAVPSKWNNPISMDDFMRMLYVAISRMKVQCYLYIGPQRKYEYFGRNLDQF